MDEKRKNPFADTRAADYSDALINEYWVDVGDGGKGFFELVKPTSQLPMQIIGGKGSGKTHIMRYLSSALQRIRHSNDYLAGVREEGYLGIYMRCSGLNSSRFEGKNQSPDLWRTVFAYYMEIWLSQLTVAALVDVLSGSNDISSEHTFVNRVCDLFDVTDDNYPNDLNGLAAYLRKLQKEIDVAVNNCGFGEPFDVKIRATSGNLIFGIPETIANTFESLSKCVFVYLVDEFENLTDSQQKLFNTLIREKRSPCSFKVGARLYGVRTYSTYCADEDNKEGSEYERLPLDTRLRENDAKYAEFAQRLLCKRLETAGTNKELPRSDDEMRVFFDAAFESIDTEGLAEEATSFVVENYADRERPYFEALLKLIEAGVRSNAAPGLGPKSNLDELLNDLRCSQYPLLEKLNCFNFFQAWYSSEDLAVAAKRIKADCAGHVSGTRSGTPYNDRLLHYKYDLLAQLRRDCKQKQLYVGFDTLVALSWGNPRNLLVLLKHIVAWSTFKGEEPFGDKPISIAAQIAGVKEAADWFFKDAPNVGSDGRCLQDSIGRLGELFRTIRYAHKPSECSPCAFSYNESAANDEANRFINLACERSLLVEIESGQFDRNSKRIDVKLQINRMLAPRFGIPINRRGVVSLSTDEVNAIFDPSNTSFDAQLSVREERMTAPFFGTKPKKKDGFSEGQGILPGMKDG